MTDVDMWTVWAEAATRLDAADCDWRTLQQIEELLRSLSTELERATVSETACLPYQSGARLAYSDLRVLQSSLAWVRQHEYDTLESELRQKLDIALRSAMSTLDHLERSQQKKRFASSSGTASGDGR